MEEGRRKNSGKASKTNDCEHYAGSMATVFRNHLQPSPLHIVGSAQMLPTSIHSLFKVFVNADPAPKHQWAITPYLLQGMYTLAGLAFPESHDTPAAIAADLAIVGLFFAVRSYENTTIPQPDQTKMVSPFWIITSVRYLRIALVSPSLSTSHSFLQIKRKETRTPDVPKVSRQPCSLLCPTHCIID